MGLCLAGVLAEVGADVVVGVAVKGWDVLEELVDLRLPPVRETLLGMIHGDDHVGSGDTHTVVGDQVRSLSASNHLTLEDSILQAEHATRLYHNSSFCQV